MKLMAPSYYPRFSCIAGACKHSCCIGWEIAVDKESYERFSRLDGGSGKILNKIGEADGEYFFRTDANGKCPFLNADGLCDLIIEYGESVLCPICADHPRFRSFYETFTEIGLGLSCEEAARIILNDQAPFSMIALSGRSDETALTEDEEEMLSMREEMIEILEDGSLPFEERISALFELADSVTKPLKFKEIADFLLSLERLDASWDVLLNELRDVKPVKLPASIVLPLQKACVYFVYRHMPRALIYDDLYAAALLSSFLCYFLWQLFSRAYAVNPSFSMVSVARLMSGELEYSDENLDLLTDMLIDLFA
ncbi:MAG: flagellin lysine-N-methylase [Clostridia bacterium]|nr:flagellin lysine-N-methylase [Clostridia bacterium]